MAIVILELYLYFIIKSPESVGLAAILIFLTLIIYFAFRVGRRGGFITTALTIGYYVYILYSRNYEGQELINALETILSLGILYGLMAGVIGWLKETIDNLIEREANEKRRIEAIIEQLPVGILIADKTQKIVKSNERMNTIMGVKVPVGFELGSSYFVPVDTPQEPPSQSPIMKALKKGEVSTNIEYTVRRGTEPVHIHISAAPIHDREGEIIAAVSIIADVTEQKINELRKDDFINMASHELKTPLTSITLYTDLILRRLKKSTDTELTQMMIRTKDQLNRLQHLVDDLLDVARIQTGKLSLTQETFVLNELIQETIDVLKETTTTHTVQLIEAEKIHVTADRFRIYQVLTNLVTNAIKYSHHGKNITVSLVKKSTRAIVCVKDEGVGIPESEHEKIFERLYQVYESTEKKSPGFGMGLFISQEIVNRHNCRIWVDSEVGKGSTFCFNIPLASPVPSEKDDT